MRLISVLAVPIVLTLGAGPARAEYHSAGGASVAKPAIQANQQVQTNAFRELAVARFIGLATVGEGQIIFLKPIIGPVRLAPAKKPMRIKVSPPNPPGR
jgi:hypothetical protein